MGEAQWFRVASRALGIWMLLEMFGELRTILIIELGWYKLTTYPFGAYVMHFVFAGALGVYLVWGAKHLSELVFGPEQRGFDVHPVEAVPSAETNHVEAQEEADSRDGV